MSLQGSLSGITFGGISSGLDTEGIISRLIQLETLPIQRLQRQQQEIATRKTVYGQLKTKLTALAQAAGALNSSAAFSPITATSSKSDVATITGSANATAGTYNLSVTYLAQAQKLSSAAQASASEALGLSAGTFVVNGKAVSVDETDSLRSIASKINSLNGGAVASVIDGGAGNAYLTLTSSATGIKNKLQLADLSGSSLSSLGVLSGAASIREVIADGATSFGFSSNSATISSLLGSTEAFTGAIEINGIGVNLDFSTDSLQAIADKINLASTGATATVRTVIEGGKSSYKLDIVGAGSTPTFSDSGNLLQALGILSQDAASSLVAAQDAQYAIDGVSLTSSSNTVTTVIPGATLTLLKANATTPETSTLTLNRDSTAVKKSIKSFADAFNALVDEIKTHSAFNKDTFAAGPLFGDSTARQIESTMLAPLFNDVPGVTGTYKNLTQIGFSVDAQGKLAVDDSKLESAINGNPDDLAALFRAVGAGSTSSISYVSSTSKTKSSGDSTYALSITQVATKGSYVAELAQTTASTQSENLTFNGALFGNTDYTLFLPTGSTLSATVAKINSDSKLKDLVVATIEGGQLKIESKRYGTNGNFTVTSTLAAGPDNSGIGNAGAGTAVAGVDVAGTIGGEAATGSGQFLMGNVGNAFTEGLQIQYTGSTTGNVGTIKLTKGVGSQLNDLVGLFTDTVNGLLPAADKSLQTQIERLDADIQRIQERAISRQQELRRQFARMEEAMARAQMQAQRIAGLNAQS